MRTGLRCAALLVFLVVVATANAAPYLQWTRGVRVDSEPLAALDCPSQSLCVGFDRSGRFVTGERARWRVTAAAPGTKPRLSGLSCPSVHLCVAVDAKGDIFTRAGGQWSAARHVDAASLTGISCPSSRLCVAVDLAGYAVTSTDPAAGAGATWSIHLIDGGEDYECFHYGDSGPQCVPGLVAVSCPAVHACVAIDWAGGILTTNDPTAPGTWPGGGGQPASASYDALACPSADSCLLAQLYTNQILGIGGVPTATLGPSGSTITGLWCRTANLCFAADDKAKLFESTSPFAGRPRWRSVLSQPVSSVSCPTTQLCFAAVGRTLYIGTPPKRRRRR